MRNAAAIEVGQQPRLPHHKFDDRRWREILGRVSSLSGRFWPCERELDVGVGPLSVGQDLQNCAQDGALTVRIVRLAERPAHRIADTCQARHSDGTCKLRNHREGYRWNTACFKNALHQSHGPATEGSGRNQYHSVDAVGAQKIGNRRRGLLDQNRRLKDVPHERVVLWRRLGDEALAGELG